MLRFALRGSRGSDLVAHCSIASPQNASGACAPSVPLQRAFEKSSAAGDSQRSDPTPPRSARLPLLRPPLRLLEALPPLRRLLRKPEPARRARPSRSPHSGPEAPHSPSRFPPKPQFKRRKEEAPSAVTEGPFRWPGVTDGVSVCHARLSLPVSILRIPDASRKAPVSRALGEPYNVVLLAGRAAEADPRRGCEWQAGELPHKLGGRPHRVV
eukprot:scaffold8559_cov248-Pinguiococcus_pyrenoidosus.AAC.1